MTGPAPTGGILLGKFRIDSVLGAHPAGDLRGGFDLRFEREVQLLVVNAPIERRQRSRLAQRLMRVSHPRLGVLLDHGELPDGKAVLVFPPPQGRPLARWLPSAEPGEVVELLDQLLQALARLHASGMTHGGIRPEVMYVQTGAQGPIAWLGEVGAATLIADGHTLSGRFAPPEGPPWTPDHDVYALARCVRRLAPELPSPLGPTLARAAASDPARRATDIGRLLNAMGRPLAADRPLTPAPMPASPEATALGGIPSQPPRAVVADSATLQDEVAPGHAPGPAPAVQAPAVQAAPPGTGSGPTEVDGPIIKRDPRVRLSAEEVVAALGPKPDTRPQPPRRITQADDSTTAPSPRVPPELEGTAQLVTLRPAGPRYALIAILAGALVGVAWALLQ